MKAPTVSTFNEEKIMASLEGNKEAIQYINAHKEALRGYQSLVATATKKIFELSSKISNQSGCPFGYTVPSEFHRRGATECPYVTKPPEDCPWKTSTPDSTRPS
jgi:hypothetical protein